jgi:hypothetical protein
MKAFGKVDQASPGPEGRISMTAATAIDDFHPHS